ncbi:MAG: hypothetical protein F4X56_09610 [Gammaproteobacteria bacterium]|nr:hypothetical protein [Gammaproteobacteria bacterium]
MRVSKNQALLVFFVLLSLVGAIAIVQLLADRDTNDYSQTLSSNTPEISVIDSAQSSSTGSSHTLRELIDLNQFDSFFARTQKLLELLEATNVKTLKEYWKQSKHVDRRSFREEIQIRIIQRWAKLNPVEALKLITRESVATHMQNLLKAVFLEWSHSDIDKAIRYAGNLDQVNKEAAVASIVLAREDLPISRRRDIGKQLGCEWIALEILGNVLREPLIDEPDLEWASFILEHEAYLDTLTPEQSKLMAYIAYHWILRDGAEVITRMREMLPQNISLTETLEFVVRKLQTTRPRLALELVNVLVNHGLDFGFRDLGTNLVRNWAEVEPDQALNATFAVEAHSLRRELQKTVLETIAEGDPYILLDQLDEIPLEVRARAHEIALLEIAKNHPESVLGMLSDVADSKARERIEAAVIEHWAIKDIGSLLQWIESNNKSTDTREEMTRDALNMLARTDPDLALEVASALPIGSNGEGMEVRVLDWIAITDLDRSIALLHHVRPGATRVRGYDTTIAMSIFAGELEQAIELFVQLCELEPSGPDLALPFLVGDAPERLFTSLDRVSSDAAKASAARSLLYWYEDDDLFSEDQLSVLREMVKPRSGR